MKENWKDLIVFICAICDTAEDGHLNSFGESFYASHKMFEDIQDSIREFADLIQETYFGARELPFVASRIIRQEEVEKLKQLKNEKDAARHLKDLIVTALDLVKIIDSDEDTTVGERDVLSKIAGTLQQKLYFIQNYLR